MLRLVAPGLHRLVIPPDRERQKLCRIGQALEALDRDEAVHLLQLLAQRARKPQIIVLAALRRPDFEDDRDHFALRSSQSNVTTLRIACPLFRAAKPVLISARRIRRVISSSSIKRPSR